MFRLVGAAAEALFRVRSGRRLLAQARAAVFLNLLFVFPQLHFDLVDHAIDGRIEIGVRFLSDEVVLVLRIDAQLDLSIVFMFQIDRQFDLSDSIEEADELFQLLANLSLGRFAQLSVACRDLGLHRVALSLKTNNGWFEVQYPTRREIPAVSRLSSSNVVGVTFGTTNLSERRHSNKASSDSQRSDDLS
jgi:hypothetical protein